MLYFGNLGEHGKYIIVRGLPPPPLHYYFQAAAAAGGDPEEALTESSGGGCRMRCGGKRSSLRSTIYLTCTIIKGSSIRQPILLGQIP